MILVTEWNLKGIHVCSKSCEASSPTATQTEKQRVAQRLSDYSTDSTDVHERIREDDQSRSSGVYLQIVIQVVFQ